MTTLTFESTTFDIATVNNQIWLRANQIGEALGYKNPNKDIRAVYERNADEFTPSMTQLIELDTAGGKQQVRVFSLRGAHLLGMFARTEKAKLYRIWVLDVLDEEIANQQPCIKNNQLDTHQARFIQEAVNDIVHKTGKHWNKIYHDIKTVFKVRSYTEATQEQFPALCEYLGVVYSGEFIAATEAPKALPDDKVTVSREYLIGLIKMVELQRERLPVIEEAEKDIQHAFSLLEAIMSGAMKRAKDGITSSRYLMHDPLTHANSYANLLKRQLA